MPAENATETPGRDCGLCPRLAAFRAAQRAAHPDCHNAPVSSFGGLDVGLLIVGLAPGWKGANLTGRPFTGDWAGDLLYATLAEFGLTAGTYGARADDGFTLRACRVTNAVRCVPPENKPVAAEVAACRPVLIDEIAAMPRLKVILALGGLAHGAVLAAFGERKSAWKFGHGAEHRMPGRPVLLNSYHCSRYNTNTGRLTADMFRDVFATIGPILEENAGI